MAIRAATLIGAFWLLAIGTFAQGQPLGAEAQGAKDGQAQQMTTPRLEHPSLPFASFAPEAYLTTNPSAVFHPKVRKPALPKPKGLWLQILPVIVTIAAIWLMFLILGLTVGGVFLVLMGITAVFGLLALAAVILALVDLVNGNSGGSRRPWR